MRGVLVYSLHQKTVDTDIRKHHLTVSVFLPDEAHGDEKSGAGRFRSDEKTKEEAVKKTETTGEKEGWSIENIRRTDHLSSSI